MTNRRWLPPFIWAAIILIVTSIPSPELTVVEPYAFAGADKIVHAALYGVLGWLAARASLRFGFNFGAAALTFASVAVFGAADEWHQQFVIGRLADPVDWIADVLGAAFGMLIFVWRQRVQPA